MASKSTAVAGKKPWYQSFWYVSFATLVIAFLLLWLHDRWEGETQHDIVLLSAIVKEAGFACLVAFFLNLSVEGINRWRHAEQESSLVRLVDEKHAQRRDELLVDLRAEHSDLVAKITTALDKKHQERVDGLVLALDEKYNETSKRLLKNVFQTVYERYIEKGIFEVIEKHVLRQNLMRKKYKISMTIRPIEGASDLVDLTFHIQYEAVNLTDHTIEMPVLGATIDITPEYEERCKFVEATIGEKTYGATELEPLVKRHVDAMWSLHLGAVLEPGQSVQVHLEYKKVGPRTYSEVICTTVQMDSLEVDVLLTDEKLTVNAVSLHPEDAVRTSSSSRHELTSWKIEHAILPGQGVVIFWHSTPTLPLEIGE